MKCPNCDVPLMMTERKGIEIDFCTECRGIWLDRGELDKIIDIASKEWAAPVAAQEPRKSKSDYKLAKSDPARQYNASRDNEHRRDQSHRDRDYDSSRDTYRDRDYDDRRRSREERYRYRKPYSKKKSLLHTLFDIID